MNACMIGIFNSMMFLIHIIMFVMDFKLVYTSIVPILVYR